MKFDSAVNFGREIADLGNDIQIYPLADAL